MEVATQRFMKLGELWKIYRLWMHTPGWTYAHQIFFVRLVAKFYEGKIILKNSKAQEEHIP
jgi:hypothetical protein